MKGGTLLTILFLVLAACSPTRAIPPAGNMRVTTPTPQPTATTSEPVRMQCTVTAEALHMRSGPGVEYSVIGYLYAGEIVTIQNQRGAWFDIGAGWINSKYCQE